MKDDPYLKVKKISNKKEIKSLYSKIFKRKRKIEILNKEILDMTERILKIKNEE